MPSGNNSFLGSGLGSAGGVLSFGNNQAKTEKPEEGNASKAGLGFGGGFMLSGNNLIKPPEASAPGNAFGFGGSPLHCENKLLKLEKPADGSDSLKISNFGASSIFEYNPSKPDKSPESSSFGRISSIPSSSPFGINSIKPEKPGEVSDFLKASTTGNPHLFASNLLKSEKSPESFQLHMSGFPTKNDETPNPNLESFQANSNVWKPNVFTDSFRASPNCPPSFATMNLAHQPQIVSSIYEETHDLSQHSNEGNRTPNKKPQNVGDSIPLTESDASNEKKGNTSQKQGTEEEEDPNTELPRGKEIMGMLESMFKDQKNKVKKTIEQYEKTVKQMQEIFAEIDMNMEAIDDFEAFLETGEEQIDDESRKAQYALEEMSNLEKEMLRIEKAIAELKKEKSVQDFSRANEEGSKRTEKSASSMLKECEPFIDEQAKILEKVDEMLDQVLCQKTPLVNEDGGVVHPIQLASNIIEAPYETVRQLSAIEVLLYSLWF